MIKGIFEQDYASMDPGAAFQAGQQKGGQIGRFAGTGLGLLLAPFTGGASIGIGGALGQGIGGAIGGNQAQQKAQTAMDNRMEFKSMYEDALKARQSEMQQSEAMRAVDDKLRMNLY